MKAVKFVKGSAVKITFDKFESELAALGWVRDDAKQEPDRAALLAEADALGISVHHRTGTDKLIELINEAKLNKE